jgi:hypothetical protein
MMHGTSTSPLPLVLDNPAKNGRSAIMLPDIAPDIFTGIPETIANDLIHEIMPLHFVIPLVLRHDFAA